MNSVKDQLSWEQFKIHSINAKKPIKKISEFNRLIAHSKNFFNLRLWRFYKWLYIDYFKRLYSFIWPGKKR